MEADLDIVMKHLDENKIRVPRQFMLSLPTLNKLKELKLKGDCAFSTVVDRAIQYYYLREMKKD